MLKHLSAQHLYISINRDGKIMNVAGFNPYGIILSSPTGEMILNAGPGITLLPQGNLLTISAQLPTDIVTNNVTPWQPPSVSNANAPKNSVYFSTDATKLVYKDAAGVVHNLY